MAFAHGKNTKVALNAANLTAFLNEANGAGEVDTAETSTFGTQHKTYVVGLQDGTVSMGGIFDGAEDAIDDYISGILGSEDDGSFLVLPAGDNGVGSRCYFGGGDVTNYEISSPVGDVVSLSLEVQADGGIRHGTSLGTAGSGTEFQSVSGAAATTNNASHDGSASSSAGAIAQVHVMNSTADGTLDIKIQDSPDDSTWADLLSFTQVAATTNTSEQVEVSGAVDRYVRAVITAAGTTGSAEVAVGFKRL